MIINYLVCITSLLNKIFCEDLSDKMPLKDTGTSLMPLQLIEENSFAETEHNSLNKQRCRMLLPGPSSFPNPLSYLGSVKVTEEPLGSAKNVFMLGNKLIFSYKY